MNRTAAFRFGESARRRARAGRTARLWFGCGTGRSLRPVHPGCCTAPRIAPESPGGSLESSLRHLYAANAVGVVVAHPVHQRQLDACAQQDGLAIVLSEASVDQRSDHRAVWIPLPEVFQAVGFLGGVAKHHHIAWLLPRVQQAPLEDLGARGTGSPLHVALPAEHLMSVCAVLLIPQHGDRLAEPGFAVLGEPAVVGFLVGKECIDDLHVVRAAVLGQGQLGGHRRSGAAAELAYDSIGHDGSWPV